MSFIRLRANPTESSRDVEIALSEERRFCWAEDSVAQQTEQNQCPSQS